MPRLLTLRCDICGLTQEEPGPGDGVKGWGSVIGVANKPGSTECILCPGHLGEVAALLTVLEVEK